MIDLSNYPAFCKDLKKVEQNSFTRLIEQHCAKLDVTEKTARKNLARLMHSTLKLSNRKGFHAMSLRDLSKHSGMSLGSIYSYINAKEDLLQLIQTHYLEVASSIFAELLTNVEDANSQLRRAIQAHVFLSEALKDWFYFTFTETKHLQKNTREQAKQTEIQSEKIFAEIIERGIVQGVYRVEQPEMLSAFIKAMLQDWYLKPWKYRERGVDATRFSDYLFSHLQLVLRA